MDFPTSITRSIITFCLLLFLGLGSCYPVKKQLAFNLLAQPKTDLGSEDLIEFFYWEFEEQESSWEKGPEGLTGIKAFRDTLQMILGEKGYAQVVQKEMTQTLHHDSLINVTNGDQKNAMLIHTGSIGYIRPINSLEAQILNYQLEKYPLIAHPTEFHGFIAYHREQGMYRVYFASSDQPWPPKPSPLIIQLEEDISAGWQLKYHLHNHYEPVSNNYLGILAPSMADAQYFKMLSEKYGLEKALITNGIHTVEIEANHFPEFESH